MGSSSTKATEVAMLLQLSWTDILMAYVLPELELHDLLALRCVSRDCQCLVNQYFETMKELKIVNRTVSPLASYKTLTCGRLRELNFAGCTFLTDEMILPILENNDTITILNLSSCEKLTAKAIQPVILKNKLKVLRLSKCPWLSAGILEALVLHQNQLESIDFSFCNNMTTKSLVLFIKHFQKITTIFLEGVPEMDDNCMIAVSKNCPDLENINVSACIYITGNGLWAVRSKCTKLKTFSMRLDMSMKEAVFLPVHRGIIQLQAGHVPRFTWGSSHKRANRQNNNK